MRNQAIETDQGVLLCDNVEDVRNMSNLWLYRCGERVKGRGAMAPSRGDSCVNARGKKEQVWGVLKVLLPENDSAGIVFSFFPAGKSAVEECNFIQLLKYCSTVARQPEL